MTARVRCGACTLATRKGTQGTCVLSLKHNFVPSDLPLRARLRPPQAESEKKAGSKDLFKFPGSMDAKIAALAIPALGTELIDPLLSACDTAFIGRLGVEPLAGVALASSVFTISSLGLNFLATASSPLITQALAGGDNASARAQVGNSITLAAILGIACVIVLEVWTSGVLHIVAGADGVSPETMDIAISYLRVRAFGIPFTLIALALSGAFRGLLDTRTPLLVLLASNSINFCLDILLIFGSSSLHIPAYGAPGAAAATVVAEMVAVGSLLFALSRTEVFPRRLGFIGWQQIKEFGVAGSAVFGRTLALQATLVLATATVARSDGNTSVDIAAHQVTLQTWFFLSYLMDSLAIAANGLVADGLGRGDPATARAAALRCLLYGGGVSAVLLGSLAAFPQGVSAIFTDTRSVQTASVPAMRVVAAMQPLNAIAFIGDGVYQGAKDFGYLAAATATACLAASLIMVTGDGALVHVWQALAVLQAGRGLGVSARWLGLNLWGFGPSPLLASDAIQAGSPTAPLLEDATDDNPESP